MATLDRKDKNEEENITLPVPACEWCRMGLHKKCEGKRKLHGFCICECERGF